MDMCAVARNACAAAPHAVRASDPMSARCVVRRLDRGGLAKEERVSNRPGWLLRVGGMYLVFHHGVFGAGAPADAQSVRIGFAVFVLGVAMHIAASRSLQRG